MTAVLMDAIKSGAEGVPDVMEGPDSDWTPILMFKGGDGACRAVGFEGLQPERVDAAVQLVGKMLREASATAAALLLPTWITRFDDTGAGKAEYVLVTYVDRETTECEAAKVLRSEDDKPRLGRWDLYSSDSEVGRGAFVDAMRAAIG